MDTFTPSLINFDKPTSFMDDVKETVISEMTEKQMRHMGSPSWTWKAQENINHTGEQPLIVQQYLSANKKEQEDGVLPRKQSTMGRFRCHSAGSSNSRRMYQLSIAAHQFLTATEMPNESERIVDHRLGRPTRTSLLRARKRIPSAPGVKANIEIRTDLHLQQSLVAKREDKHKTVDIPVELLPNTDADETVHQFLVGARYNRGHYRDAKCLNNLGLYVCRDDITKCFLSPSSSNSNVSPKAMTSESLMHGQHSHSSSSIRMSRKGAKSPSCRPKSALQPTTKPTEPLTSKSPPSSCYGPPTINSPTDSPNTGNTTRVIATTTVIDGRCLKSVKGAGDKTHGAEDGGCVLCQTGVPLCKGSSPAWSKSERRTSDATKSWDGTKSLKPCRDIGDRGPSRPKVNTTGNRNSLSTSYPNVDKELHHMVLQQYHLRIMGMKVGVNNGIPSAPRSNLLYQNFGKTCNSPSSSRARSISGDTKVNTSANNNKRNESWTSRINSMESSDNETEGPSSEISVHISTRSHSESDCGSSYSADHNVVRDERTPADGNDDVQHQPSPGDSSTESQKNICV